MAQLAKQSYTKPNDNHLGTFPTGIDGFSSRLDQEAQQRALVNPYLSTQHWRDKLCFQDLGDETFDPNAYAYIPTEWQILSMIAARNRQLPNEGPSFQLEPGMNNLLQGIQKSVQNLLNNIREATGTSQW